MGLGVQTREAAGEGRMGIKRGKYTTLGEAESK